MTQKKQADSNEELKNIPQEETATTDAPETMEGDAPETAAESAVTAETVKAEMMDRILRLQADFDNYRRRTRQEQTELSAFVTQNLLKELLPVIDNFERALGSRPVEDPSGFGAGVEMIFRQLYGVLEKQGISTVAAVGEMFDPNRHEAILKDADSDQPEGTVVAELQKGYAVGGKVIRPALVRVAGK
jgi:molecular chaperone GrpE